MKLHLSFDVLRGIRRVFAPHTDGGYGILFEICMGLHKVQFRPEYRLAISKHDVLPSDVGYSISPNGGYGNSMPFSEKRH